MRKIFLLFALFLASGFGTMSQANEVTFDEVDLAWETNGIDEATRQRWTMLRYDVKGFRINGACYLQCRLQFSLESLIDGSFPRYHIGVISGETVNASFVSSDGSGTFRKGYAGPSAQPPGFNRMVRSFPPADLLTIAWIVENSEWLIESALASGRISDAAFGSWQKLPRRFEQELKSELGFLRPYIRSLEQ
jgi:hypothetical protein